MSWTRIRLELARGPGHPELNADRATLAAITDGLAAFRQGAGPEMGIHLDTNFNFKTAGYIKVARACEPYDLSWLEIDSYDPAAWNAGSDADLNPELASPPGLQGLSPAAVLIALVAREEGFNVLLTRRSDGLRRHAGQIAFPGGRCDPQGASAGLPRRRTDARPRSEDGPRR